jgi:hypothetical protein
MREFIEVLEQKLGSEDQNIIDNCNQILVQQYQVSPNAREEVGYFLHLVNEGLYPKENIYDFLYKFIDFYYEDAEYLFDYANIILYAVSVEWIDPIIGSRLIGSIWTVLGYPPELTDFIGTEGEVEYHDNRLRNEDISETEKLEINGKLDQIRTKLIRIAKEYVENNTF